MITQLPRVRILLITHAELHVWLGRSGRPLNSAPAIFRFMCRLCAQKQNWEFN